MTSLGSGYLDETGALVIPTTLRDAGRFHGGLAIARPFGARAFGFLGLDGRWVVAPTIAGVQEWSEGVAAFNVGGTVDDDGDVIGGAWGLVGDGRVLVPPTLSDVGGCGQGLIPFCDGLRWGYLDRAGAVAIEPRFDDADDVSADGVAVVTEDGKDGYLRADGTWALPPRFDRLAPTSEGRGRAKTGAGWHVIDLDAGVLSEPFDEILPFHGGLARVARGGRYAFVDRAGALIGDAWFDETLAYDGLAPVCRRDRWYLLDARGALHGPYDRALPPTEGLARIVDGGRTGFVALDGTVRVAPRYDAARGFHHGRAAVQRGGLWTYVDATGAELHPPYWHHAGNFHDGLATVRYGARAGCVALTGHVAIPLEWDVIDAFSGGRAAAKQVTWRAVAPPPPAWHVTPRDGLAFRGFAGAGAADAVRVHVGFARDLDDDARTRAAHVVAAWREVADAHAGGDAVDDEWVAADAVSVRVAGVPYPVELAQVLLDELRDEDLPIQDVAVARLRAPDDPALAPVVAWAAVADPDDPGGPSYFETFEAYARQALDGAPPPASEAPAHLLAGRADPTADDVAHAERTFTLHHPDVRICYGVSQAPPEPPDARAGEVAAAVERALAARFDRARVWVSRRAADPGVPRPRTRAGAPGVDAIAVALPDGPRRGYAFTVDAATLLHDLGPRQYRYRENELMEALADAIADAGLAPVVMWQRFGEPLPGPAHPDAAHPMKPTIYAINLWERAPGSPG